MYKLGFVPLSLLATVAWAQDTTPSPAPNPVTWHAMLMSSYQYNLNAPASGLSTLRVFDTEHRSWRLNTASLSVGRTARPLGFQVDLVTGDDALTMASFGAWEPDVIDFTQAFVAVRPAVLHGVELRAGKFATTAGYEVISAWDNVNVTQSRSFLFGYAIPFTHTGARALVPLGARASAVLGVNRGWDKWDDNNDALSFEASVSYAPSAAVSLTFDTHHGPEQDDDQDHQRHLYDVVATVRVSPSTVLGLNFDYATEDAASVVDADADATWYGWALYQSRTLGRGWSLGARVEQFHDRDGARTGVAQRLTDLDLTLDWAPSERFLFRFDTRFDRSTEAVFERKAGDPNARHQATAGLTIVARR
jgi:putative OmpL-like beta-barrel porin-2